MGEAFITRRGGGGGGGSSKGLPIFSYTGSYQLVDDSDAAITDPAYKGYWKIRLLTSGTLTFTKLNSAKNGIDVFCVGGGGGTYGSGGGGGGGYTQTAKLIPLIENEEYEIIIGAGGVGNTKGGNTSAFGVIANGGDYGYGGVGHPGHGGSGGGAYGGYQGGSDGGDGSGAPYAGKGQGTTTREFGEPTGKLYAGGGGSGSASGGAGGGAKGGTSAAANTGGGAGGMDSGTKMLSGGSGIVVIRNARG